MRPLSRFLVAVAALCACRGGSAYDWAGFHGGASYSRESIELIGTPVSQAWRVSLEGSMLGSPVIANGRVYAGTRNGYLYCLDLATGATVWTRFTGDLEAPVVPGLMGPRLDATPAVVHGRVYVGTGGGEILCLNAANGSLVWKRRHGGEQMSSPLVASGMVVVGVGSPSFDIRAYGESDGQELWRFATPQCVYSSPVSYRGAIYCGSSSGDYFCLDLNGALLWQQPTTGGVQMSSPEMRYGRCYALPGHFDPKLYAWDAASGAPLWSGNPASPPAASPSNPTLDQDFLQEVLSQDPADREAYIRAWGGIYQQDLSAYQEIAAYTENPDLGATDFPAQPPFITAQHIKPSSPAVGADHVLFAHKGLGAPNPRFSVVCMRATTGQPQWWYQEVAPAEPVACASTPAVSLDRVFVGLASRLYTFDLSSGQLLDSRQLDGDVYTSPAIGNGMVVAGTLAGSLYAFQTANHAPALGTGVYSPSGEADVRTATPTLAWPAALDADAADTAGTLRYLLEVDDDGELDWNYDNQYSTVPGQTSYTLPAVPDNTRLTWRVRAADASGALSPWSPPSSFTVNKASVAPLEDPRFLTAVPQSGQVYLFWQAPESAAFDGYRLTVRDEFGGQRSPMDLGKVLSTTVTGLTNFVRYTFHLSTFRTGGGESPGVETSAIPRPLISIGKEPYATLEDALKAAKAGDTINLGAGTVQAKGAVLKKGISLVGVGPGFTILEGRASDRAVLVVDHGTAGQPPLISMMTVTKGAMGILIENGGRATVRNVILMGNTADGLHLENGARVEAVNCTIADNGGSGILLEEGGGEKDKGKDDKDKDKDKDKDDKEDKGKNVFRNTILAFNAGWGIHAPKDESPTYGDAHGNGQGDYGGGAAAGNGCISSDPMFETRTANGYVPKEGSPCVDAGDPADAFDQEPKPNGERIDMGAYGNTPFATGSNLRALAKAAAPGCFLSSAWSRR